MPLGDNVIHPLWICDTSDAEEPCEPRPRVVPSDPPPPGEAPRDLYGLPVTRYGVVLPFDEEEMVETPDVRYLNRLLAQVHEWLRGIGYDALRSELADGYYPDDTLNP